MPDRVTRLFCFFAVILSTACGGGGGGGGGTTSPPAPSPSFLTISPSTVTAKNVEGGVSLGSSFSAVLTAAGQDQFAAGDTVYIVLSANTSAITGMTVTIAGTSGQVSVAVDSSLAMGTYSGNITVRLCKDAGCAALVSNTQVPFQYEVLAPAVGPDDLLELDLVRYQDQSLPSDQFALKLDGLPQLVSGPFIKPLLDANNSLSDTDVDNAWADFVLANNIITATATDLDVPCGQSDGRVEVRYGTSEFTHTAFLAARLNVTSLPVVESIQPNMAFTDRADEFTVVGCGFVGVDPADLLIGGVSPVAATRISDREIVVSLPPGMTAGRHDISFSSLATPAGAPTGQLLVKEPQARPNLDFDISTSTNVYLWDEQRERLYMQFTPDNVTMFENSGTEWVITPNVFGSDPIHQFILSADGRRIITLVTLAFNNGTVVAYYDADSLTKLGETNIKKVDSGIARQVVDKFGQLYFDAAFNSRVSYRVHSTSGTFLRLIESPGSIGSAAQIYISPNRDIIHSTHDSNSDGWYRIDTSDESIQFQQQVPLSFTAIGAVVSRTGRYAEFDANSVGTGMAIFDENLALVGTIPTETQLDDTTLARRRAGIVFDESQNVAIASFSNGTSGVEATAVRYEMYDLGAVQNSPFQAVAAFEQTGVFERPSILDKFFISDDGQTIFRLGTTITIRPNEF